MMDMEFWMNWGVAGAFAGILLMFLLKSVVKRLDVITDRMVENRKLLTWLYTKHDGPPIIDSDDD